MTPQEIEKAIVSYFEGSDSDIVAVYLFGSFGRGEARASSDVDLGVLYAQPPPATLASAGFDIGADLSERLGRAVDVITMNRAPVDLVHRILRDGRLLIERNASNRIAFEVRARNEYFDLLPILERYRATSRAMT